MDDRKETQVGDNTRPTRGAENLVRHELVAMEPYESIAPLEALSQRAGVPLERVIKLDGNENPYGCSPRVRSALADYSYYHIYPDPMHRELGEELEDYVGIGREHIVAGSGSDELIDLILRLFLQTGDKVLNCVPTFGMYSFSTTVCGGEIVNIPRDAAYEIDLTAVKSAIDRRTKVIFIASPNNPTGNITSQSTILELLDTGIIVVVDEAYYEFSGVTAVTHVPKYPNLIVLRSFSKWAGLGGLRVGYGIFPISIAKFIYKIKPPYNVNVAAQIAAKESLVDADYLNSRVRAIITERERLGDELRTQGVLNPLPSQANFILCSVVDGNALKIKNGLEKEGIFIRHFNSSMLRNMLRISVGKPEHTDALIAALSKTEGGKGG
ncbi:histidinol-phosphate transaminase [Chloroflexota bacterium]